MNIEDSLRNIIKIGKVSEINNEKCSVKVTFADSNNIVSYYLPVIQRFAGKDKNYILPALDDTVVCLFPYQKMPGFVLGSIYDQANPPIINDENKFNITFEDETTLEYDKKENSLMLDVKGKIDIIVDKTLKVSVTEDLEQKGKNVKITGDNIELNGVCKVGENANKAIIHEDIITVLNNIITILKVHTHTTTAPGSETSTSVSLASLQNIPDNVKSSKQKVSL